MSISSLKHYGFVLLTLAFCLAINIIETVLVAFCNASVFFTPHKTSNSEFDISSIFCRLYFFVIAKSL